jgi:hypothetical protein
MCLGELPIYCLYRTPSEVLIYLMLETILKHGLVVSVRTVRQTDSKMTDSFDFLSLLFFPAASFSCLITRMREVHDGTMKDNKKLRTCRLIDRRRLTTQFNHLCHVFAFCPSCIRECGVATCQQTSLRTLDWNPIPPLESFQEFHSGQLLESRCFFLIAAPKLDDWQG